MELRGLEPLTSSMPSTVGLCGGPALRLASGPPPSLGLVSSLVISLVVKLTFSLRRPATEAYELHRCLLLGAWRADGSVPVRLGGTPGVLHPTAPCHR